MTKKLIFTIFICLFVLGKIFSQAPNMINYQGVALNNGSTPIANQNIKIRASVHNLTPNGTILYSEERSLTTEVGGLFNFQIGGPGATATSGSWAAITWSSGAKHLQIEMDPTGGTNFVDMGTQQLVSVPYAQYSNLSGGIIPTATINPNQINAGGAINNQVLKYNGTNWVPGTDVSAFALPFAATNSSITSFEITNPSGIALKGETTTGYGIMGEVTGSSGRGVHGLSNGASGIGINGESAAGTGVKGYGNNEGSIGVFGGSLAGTGVKAISFTGNALEVNGNVKIAGGNTNPSIGAVFTSDASGNATWKAPNKVIFKAFASSGQSISHSTFTSPNFSENFDAGSDFNPNSAGADPNTFIAPVSGYYQFTSEAGFQLSSNLYNILYTDLRYIVNGTQAGIEHSTYGAYNGTASSFAAAKGTQTFHLNGGDKVKVQVSHSSGNSTTATLTGGFFEGHLIFAD